MGDELTEAELKKAHDGIKKNHPDRRSALIDFTAEKRAIIKSDFKEGGRKQRVNYLIYQMMGNFPSEISNLACKLEKLSPSSAGLERMFSTMGFIQSDLRNRLKLEKLTFIKRVLSDVFCLEHV